MSDTPTEKEQGQSAVDSSTLLAARDAVRTEREKLGAELERAVLTVLEDFEGRTGYIPRFVSVRLDQWSDGERPSPEHSIEMVGRC